MPVTDEQLAEEIAKIEQRIVQLQQVLAETQVRLYRELGARQAFLYLQQATPAEEPA